MKLMDGGAVLAMELLLPDYRIPTALLCREQRRSTVQDTFGAATIFTRISAVTVISPVPVHTPFVDDFLRKTYSRQDKRNVLKQLSHATYRTMGTPEKWPPGMY
jgi:hypothetical protein